MLLKRTTWGILPIIFLSSCGSHNKQAPTTRLVDVVITTGHNVNLNAEMQAQPIKICIIEVNRPGWLPEGTGDGVPCREGHKSEEILGREQRIFQPNETQHYKFNIPAKEERWFVIGAEFQKLNGKLPVIERKSPAFANSVIKVKAEEYSLSIVVNNKYR